MLKNKKKTRHGRRGSEQPDLIEKVKCKEDHLKMKKASSNNSLASHKYAEIKLKNLNAFLLLTEDYACPRCLSDNIKLTGKVFNCPDCEHSYER